MTFVTQAWVMLVALCLIYAACCDIAVRLIPNRLCLGILCLALPFRLLNADLISSIAIAALVFAVLFGAWLLRLLGGGDVKFWTACSLLIPPGLATQGLFALRVILLGGVVALIYLVLRFVVHRSEKTPDPHRKTDTSVQSGKTAPARLWLARVWRAEQWRARRNGSIPYGVAIALSAWLTFAQTVHP